MTYFNTRFQGSSIPMTDARQTKQFLENIKNQEQQRKDRAKALAEDQKRLGLIAQGLGLEKGEIDSMSRGQLQGFIDATLQRKQEEQNLQAHNMSLAKFALDKEKAKSQQMIAQSQLLNAETNQMQLLGSMQNAEAQSRLEANQLMGLQNFLGGQPQSQAMPPPAPQGPQVAPFGGGAPMPMDPRLLNKFAQGTGAQGTGGVPSAPPPPPTQQVSPQKAPGFEEMTPQQRMLALSQSGMDPKTINQIAGKVLPDMINPPKAPVNTRETADEAMLKKLAEVAVKDYNDFQVNGGIEGAREKMKRINSIKQKLSSGQIKTGRLINAVGGLFEKFLDPQAVGAKQALETIFQENLRETIGAQFTENEAKMFLERAYDPALPNKTNIEKINYALSQMTTLQNYKAQYFNALQTGGAEALRSFKYDPSVNIFDNGPKTTQLDSGNRASSFTPPSIPGSNIKILP